MKNLWLWVAIVWVLLLLAAPWTAYAGEIIDLPPIDLDQGDWWVALLVWYLTRYYNRKPSGPS